MFGYVRPLKSELKEEEYLKYHKVYCSLCNSLKERFGFISRFCVNFDFTFLSMFLTEKSDVSDFRTKCPAKFGRKVDCCCNTSVSDYVADCCIILTYWKLLDGISDEVFYKRIFYRFLKFLLSKPFRKSCESAGNFNDLVSHNLKKLLTLEKSDSASLDECADCFASILAGIASGSQLRQKSEALYHLGRIIYIIDAVDDFKDDKQKNHFNPLPFDGCEIRDEDLIQIKETIYHSQNRMCKAFELMESNYYQSILENIFFSGIPWVCESVFCGKWKEFSRLKIHLFDRK